MTLQIVLKLNVSHLREGLDDGAGVVCDETCGGPRRLHVAPDVVRDQVGEGGHRESVIIP